MKKHWFCVATVNTNDGVIFPAGADGRPRTAVIASLEALAGVESIETISSGWNLSDAGASTLRLEACMPVNNVDLSAPAFRVGDPVLVHDRFRFAIPLTAVVVALEGISANGARIKLTQSNAAAYPVGWEIVVSQHQLTRA